MKLYKRLYENSIDDFFDDIEDNSYIERSYDFDAIKDHIKEWLEKYAIIEGSYCINDNLTIDIEGSIKIQNSIIDEFPNYIRFNKITENYSCLYLYNLKSMRGFPIEVGKDFNCSNCNAIRNLEYCPKKVGRSFFCMCCRNLESLKGCPEHIYGNFSIQGNILLQDFKGGPKKVDGFFNCSYCYSLRNLSDAPEYVGGDFYTGSFFKDLIKRENFKTHIKGTMKYLY